MLLVAPLPYTLLQKKLHRGCRTKILPFFHCGQKLKSLLVRRQIEEGCVSTLTTTYMAEKMSHYYNITRLLKPSN